jgi:glutamate N-acetyltransferase/amino-acid N-acetyltransferase
MPPVSPLAPTSQPTLPPIAGVRLATVAAGIRYKNREDLMLAELAPGSTIAGVVTRSKTCGPPVEWCKAHLAKGKVRGLVVNSGNSNTFTGKRGRDIVRATATAAAKLLGAKAQEIFISSTGVIGEPPAAERILDALPPAHTTLSADNFAAAARAIMTTDTFPKMATRTARIGGTEVRINGIAKGSGMIAPDMATMLVYIFTDAAIPAPILKSLVQRSNDTTFNCITVDGDTSTSDTLLLCATGKAGNPKPRAASDPKLADFRKQLHDLMVELAHLVVRDGEGATRFVAITVKGATSAQAARRIGLTVANSPLVKTAIAGCDANWGRIVAAVGRSGERVDRDRLGIRIGGVQVARKGGPVPGYDETPVVAHMRGQEIAIELDIGLGKGAATVWTCDLTHGYIDINGSYRS